MREGIHPNYYQAKVVCNCGNEFVTGSTKEEIVVRLISSIVVMALTQTSGISGRFSGLSNGHSTFVVL